MGCEPQQRVPFNHGLPDEPELAILEVPDTSVDHMRGRSGRALAVVAAFHQGDVDALKRQVTECSNPVYPSADDKNGGSRRILQLPYGLPDLIMMRERFLCGLRQ
ncbi:hypothetical protein GCM10027403_32080 [Arthrobacter tecti]